MMQVMTKAVLPLMLAGLLLGCEAGSERDFAEGDKPQQVSVGEAVIRGAKGELIDLAKLKEQWVVVNYWAEWCAPCREEIPELNELHHAHQGNGVVVIGVNFDAPELAELQRQIAALGVQFPVAQEDISARMGFEVPGVLPTTYVLGPAAQQHKLIGPQTRKDIEAFLP